MVDYLTPNEIEAAFLADEHSASLALDGAYLLNSKFNIKNLVITLGKKGAAIIGYHNQIVPPPHAHSIDTTGAGDAFNGGPVVALARGDTLFNAVKFANAVASRSTNRSGAQPSMPTLDEAIVFLDSQNSAESSRK
jgi:ribokinase